MKTPLAAAKVETTRTLSLPPKPRIFWAGRELPLVWNADRSVGMVAPSQRVAAKIFKILLRYL